MATLESEHEESLKEKPEPETWTEAPALAYDGLTVMDMAAVVRVKTVVEVVVVELVT
jgi:hypothetical protein